jgi:hypothetical protein
VAWTGVDVGVARGPQPSLDAATESRSSSIMIRSSGLKSKERHSSRFSSPSAMPTPRMSSLTLTSSSPSQSPTHGSTSRPATTNRGVGVGLGVAVAPPCARALAALVISVTDKTAIESRANRVSQADLLRSVRMVRAILRAASGSVKTADDGQWIRALSHPVLLEPRNAWG